MLFSSKITLMLIIDLRVRTVPTIKIWAVPTLRENLILLFLQCKEKYPFYLQLRRIESSRRNVTLKNIGVMQAGQRKVHGVEAWEPDLHSNAFN